MSKSKRGGGGGGGHLGRSLIKEKKRSKKSAGGAGSWLHSSEVGDGYEWGRLNLQSVTEESRLDEFLSTAELAGTEFTAEKLNIKVVDPGSYTGLPTEEERKEMQLTQEENKHFLKIPRRPEWDSDTSAEQLELLERDGFLKWRRQLADLQENERLVVTPFEKNLEFWRQLWRVIERSDVVVQIVDARNPLLFRCEDLEKYVKEIDSKKVNMLLISKADLLTSKQRKAWQRYFEDEASIKVAFWSALAQSEQEKTSVPHKSNPSSASESLQTRKPPSNQIDGATAGLSPSSPSAASNGEGLERQRHTDVSDDVATALTQQSEETVIEDRSYGLKCPKCAESAETEDSARLLTREELIEQLLSVSPVAKGDVTTVGMVGYPNVGKSSTINALFQGKKVPVSATPGRTKHFQTLYVTEELMLCDCPGLVFPNFVSSKAEMVCSGILPIDRMRDHIPPISLVCQRMPRPLLESTYGIKLPQPGEGEDQKRDPYAHELLEAYGYMRGFMTQHGRPDNPRSARYILKDYVNGKLLFCHPPPRAEPSLFNDQFFHRAPLTAAASDLKEDNSEALYLQSDSITTQKSIVRSEFDESYFKQEQVRAIVKGVHGNKDVARRTGKLNEHHSNSQTPEISSNVPESDTASFTSVDSGGKPWKKHHNRNKKEKTRRTH